MKKKKGLKIILIIGALTLVAFLINAAVEYDRQVKAKAWDARHTAVDGKVYGHNPYK